MTSNIIHPKLTLKKIPHTEERNPINLSDTFKGKFVINNRIIFDPKIDWIGSSSSSDFSLLKPSSTRLLVVFCLYPNEILHREFLVDTLWSSHGMIVSDNTLNKAISHLRSDLLNLRYNGIYIKTINRIGYVFIGNVVFEM
ncbi:winged helix-turn-helix domain-containing protein [Burkholderia sp. GbtcB21]|uniref:winged helix-turn-helix domain-containing protein n=1 Tax=Burkholderia sp. GbtcB21 TaxID=2824766 RepID=UPI001C300FF4